MKYAKRIELKAKAYKTKFEITTVTDSSQAAKFMCNLYKSDINIYESFFIVLLNQKNETIDFAKISQGGVAGTVVDIKILAKIALERLSPAVIVCHNHPSGNAKPSEADIHITKKIKAGLKLLDICLLDHIILVPDSLNDELIYTSMADQGYL